MRPAHGVAASVQLRAHDRAARSPWHGPRRAARCSGPGDAAFARAAVGRALGLRWTRNP